MIRKLPFLIFTLAASSLYAAIPAAPTDLTASTALLTPQIDLTWTDNDAQGGTTYNVERSPDGIGSWTIISIPSLGADVTTYSDTLVNGCEILYYRVIGTNGGPGPPSNIARAEVLDTRPGAPWVQGPVITPPFVDMLGVTWNNNKFIAVGGAGTISDQRRRESGP